MTREEATKLLEEAGTYEYIRGYGTFCIPKHGLWKTIDRIYDQFEQQLSDYEKRLCDVARLANRVILIGEEEGWFEWKGDADKGGNHSSLHRDLTKVANQRVYKDFCDMHVKMINTLEQQLYNLKHNYEMQEIIIADYKKRINELEVPKSCETCLYYERNEYQFGYHEGICLAFIVQNKDFQTVNDTFGCIEYKPKDKQ